MNKKIIDAIGTILLFMGFFLAFLPHAIHTAVGLNKEASHLQHVAFGVIFVVIALVILACNNKAIKMLNK